MFCVNNLRFGQKTTWKYKLFCGKYKKTYISAFFLLFLQILNGLYSAQDFKNTTTIKLSPKLNKNAKQSSCVEPGSKVPCSGKGSCLNGTCMCQSDEEDPLYRYSGKYCEECPYCPGQRCSNFLPCLECWNFGIRQKNFSCNGECSFAIIVVDNISRNVSQDDKMCDVEDANGCFVLFKYFYSDVNEVTVFVKKDKMCFNGYNGRYFDDL